MTTGRRITDNTHDSLGAYVLHVGAGFVAKERLHVLAALGTLKHHLSRWDPRLVSLEVSLQDRGRREQRVTLRTNLPGLGPLIAVGESPDVARALHHAKQELIRQLDQQSSMRAPRHDRKLGDDTSRDPNAAAGHRPS